MSGMGLNSVFCFVPVSRLNPIKPNIYLLTDPQISPQMKSSRENDTPGKPGRCWLLALFICGDIWGVFGVYMGYMGLNKR